MTSSGKSKDVTLPGIQPANFTDFLLWILGQRKKYRIEGHSMLPLLKPGEEVFVSKKMPAMGEVGAFIHEGKIMIKMATSKDGDFYEVHGLNQEDSLDSKTLGPLKAIGTVVAKI